MYFVVVSDGDYSCCFSYDLDGFRQMLQRHHSSKWDSQLLYIPTIDVRYCSLFVFQDKDRQLE